MHPIRRIITMVCVALLLTAAWQGPMDAPATERVNAGLQQALATYATARLLHGAVSVLQGTQISASPAGIGATFAPGQMLAPAAEMLKQFSDVMLLVCASFGVQKLLIAIGAYSVLTVALTVVALGWSTLLWRSPSQPAPAWLGRVLVVLLLVRFAVPLTVLGSDLLFQNFLQQSFLSSSHALDSTSVMAAKAPAADLTVAVEPPAAQSLLDQLNVLESMKSWLQRKSSASIAKYEAMKMALNDAVEHVVMLMAVFVLQTILLPLFMLWGLQALMRLALSLAQRAQAPISME